MTADRYHELATAIAALEAEGVSISAKHLHQRLGGSYPALVADLREYRSLVAAVAVEQSIDVLVDVPEEAMPLPDPAPWVPGSCPRCAMSVVWVLRADTWTCTVCSTSIRRVEADRLPSG